MGCARVILPICGNWRGGGIFWGGADRSDGGRAFAMHTLIVLLKGEIACKGGLGWWFSTGI